MEVPKDRKCQKTDSLKRCSGSDDISQIPKGNYSTLKNERSASDIGFYTTKNRACVTRRNCNTNRRLRSNTMGKEASSLEDLEDDHPCGMSRSYSYVIAVSNGYSSGRFKKNGSIRSKNKQPKSNFWTSLIAKLSKKRGKCKNAVADSHINENIKLEDRILPNEVEDSVIQINPSNENDNGLSISSETSITLSKKSSIEYVKSSLISNESPMASSEMLPMVSSKETTFSLSETLPVILHQNAKFIPSEKSSPPTRKSHLFEKRITTSKVGLLQTSF